MKDTEKKTYGRITLVTFIALLLGTTLLFGFMILPYLLALLAGGMLALIFYPLYKRILKWHSYPRIVSILLTIALILLFIIPISIFIFLAIKQGVAISEELAGDKHFTTDGLFERVSRWPLFDYFFKRPQEATRHLYEWLQKIGAMAASAIFSAAAFVPNLFLQIILVLLSFFYFLIDGPRFIAWISDRIPLDLDVRKKIARTFSDTTVSVIWATLAAAGVQSLIMFLAFLVLAVPGIFLATAATFVFSWIPILGSTPVWLLGAFYLYTKNAFFKAILMLLFGIIAGLSDNLVRPLVLRGRANMHPLVSLVAIFGGIGIFGLLGVFIGPIIAAVLTSLLQVWPLIGQRFGVMVYSVKKNTI